jgi:SET domain-containing protein
MYKAIIIAQKPIKAGEEIKYLCGIRAILIEEEEDNLDQRGHNFSIIIIARNRATSYLAGPVGFVNHDCKANARFTLIRSTRIKATAVRDIKVGEEITVSYNGSYFREDNYNCVYKTCEVHCRNSWTSEDRTGFYPSLEVSLKYESQQERQEKLDDLLSTNARGSTRSTSKCTGSASGILTSGSDVGPIAWSYLDRCFEVT